VGDCKETAYISPNESKENKLLGEIYFRIFDLFDEKSKILFQLQTFFLTI